jgi:uncharacterized protein YcsI (UPF0317 family)
MREQAMATATMRREKPETFSAGRATRPAIRRNQHVGPTSGLAPGFVQANLAILPQALARDFLQFCQHNPKPCPLIGVSAPGETGIPALAEDLDIRTDLPRYRVWCDGALVDEPNDTTKYWRDDLVTFAIGCSFSFEHALLDHGIELRHMTCDCTVPMYRTSVETVPAGPFHGPLVVSVRPMKPADAIRAVQITRRFPSVHDAPVHLGKPEMIGIRDLTAPDWGDPVPVHDDEIPVFWACGVTPQSVIMASRPEFCITHYLGAMLVTDRRNNEFAIM